MSMSHFVNLVLGLPLYFSYLGLKFLNDQTEFFYDPLPLSDLLLEILSLNYECLSQVLHHILLFTHIHILLRVLSLSHLP